MRLSTKELKEYHAIITEIWTIFKEFAGATDAQSIRQAVERLDRIPGKHPEHKTFAYDMVTCFFDEMDELTKRGEKG